MHAQQALWLDDIRRPPNDGSWAWARTLEDAKLLVTNHRFSTMSLDHDLGLHEFDPDEEDADIRRLPSRYNCRDCAVISFEKALNVPPDFCTSCGSERLSLIQEPNGLDFARWLVDEHPDRIPATVTIHSMNNVCAMQMAYALQHNTHVIVKPYQRWYKE